MKILDRVAEHNVHLAKVEAAPRLDGRNMVMVLAPDKRVQAEWARQHADEQPDRAPAADNGAAPAAGPVPDPPPAAPTVAGGALPSEDPATDAASRE